jgi:hypothetical protein
MHHGGSRPGAGRKQGAFPTMLSKLLLETPAPAEQQASEQKEDGELAQGLNGHTLEELEKYARNSEDVPVERTSHAPENKARIQGCIPYPGVYPEQDPDADMAGYRITPVLVFWT